MATIPIRFMAHIKNSPLGSIFQRIHVVINCKISIFSLQFKIVQDLGNVEVVILKTKKLLSVLILQQNMVAPKCFTWNSISPAITNMSSVIFLIRKTSSIFRSVPFLLLYSVVPSLIIFSTGKSDAVAQRSKCLYLCIQYLIQSFQFQ